jgi:SAM-dependent methyltransferase
MSLPTHAKEIVPANNAQGSITVGDWEAFMQKNIRVSSAWDYMVTLAISKAYRFGRSENKIGPNILDIGCGNGGHIEQIAVQCLRLSLTPRVNAIDIVEENVNSAKRRLERHGVDTSKINQGDITRTFPNDQYDLITAFELIHWLTPSDTRILFENISNSLNPGGRLVISHCTRLNNALLRDKDGKIDFSRSRLLPHDSLEPIHVHSYSTDKPMTFWTRLQLTALGESFGLQLLNFANIPNLYFPTRPQFRDKIELLENKENMWMCFERK